MAKKKQKRQIASGIAHVHSSYNNTIITITDEVGEALLWSSAGALGFKGSKKSTPYAAQLVAQTVIKAAQEYGIKELSVKLKGIGPGKDASIRQFNAGPIQIKSIKDVTPIPHNGVRKKKKYLL